MNKEIEKYTPFMSWIIEVAEEKIIEHRQIKKQFNSHAEFIIFTIIWMRVYKKIYQIVKEQKKNKKNSLAEKSLDEFILNFYNNQKDQYLGITINAITRESMIPRSTVKRIVERLIISNLVIRNSNRLIVPTNKVREFMKEYRQFIFQSNSKLYKMFSSLDLLKLYDQNETF